MRRLLTLFSALLMLTGLFALGGCSHSSDEKELPHDSSLNKAPATPAAPGQAKKGVTPPEP